jgi:hypothetical protein
MAAYEPAHREKSLPHGGHRSSRKLAAVVSIRSSGSEGDVVSERIERAINTASPSTAEPSVSEEGL